MIAFDTDVLTEILLGNPAYVERVAAIPPNQQSVPVIVVEEILLGRMNVVRQAEASNAKISLPLAFQLLEQTLSDLQNLTVLSYTDAVDARFREWRKQQVRIGSQDMRIAATCVAHLATLVSRNRRDFDRVPGLTVDYWY